ncbi:Homoserine dehydrogenase [Xanthoria parietina]
MGKEKQVSVAILGAGGVGRCFLQQCSWIIPQYPNVSLVFLSRSNRSLRVPTWDHELSLDTWEKDLAASTDPAPSPQELLDWFGTTENEIILVDNTSSQDIAAFYPQFLKDQITVVTPNKKAFSSDLDLWKRIVDNAYPYNPDAGFLYHEASVGAGLPIISTLKDLLETGDEVQKIEGVFSGTMSFLFNNFAPVEGKGGKWSDEVSKAKDAGYTEPDPRDDLNGVDVARKLVILARMVGLEIESTSAFPVQSLIPTELESCSSGDEFLERLPAFDDEMEKVKAKAEEKGKVVRFVGSIDVARKAVEVGLKEFDKGHAIAGLKGSDNIISFYTKRYGSNPLIVQGAGAGGEVTAMGVSADLIKAIKDVHGWKKVR